jgi:ABC-type amino acid transport substrate-binding protein
MPKGYGYDKPPKKATGFKMKYQGNTSAFPYKGSPMKNGEKGAAELKKFTPTLKPTATDSMAVHMYENVYKDDFEKKHGNWSDIYHAVIKKFPDLKGKVTEAPEGTINAAEARKKYKLGIYK